MSDEPVSSNATMMPETVVLLPYAYDIAPGQRYRWEQWQRFLTAQGQPMRLVHFTDERLTRLRAEKKKLAIFFAFLWRYLTYLLELPKQVRSAAYVVVYRNAAMTGPPIIEFLLWLFGKKIIYDIDDAVYMRPPYFDSLLRRILRCDWRAKYISKMAVAIGAGNDELLAYLGQFNDTRFLWRTTIDMQLYDEKTQRNAVPVVGWTGSETTSVYIRQLLPQLAQLQQEIDFKVLIVGAQIDLSEYGVKGECKAWSSEQEVALVHEMDIGVMPLEDSPWERGKCSLKALQYQAVGIPAVVSDVGMNPVAVLHEQSGLVVPVGADWKAPLKRLLMDMQLRQKLGEAGRAHVQAHFSCEVVASKVQADITQLAGLAV